MLFRIGDNVAVTCKNPNETLLFINRVPTAWLFSIDIEICQKVKRMIVEEQNLKDIKIEYESERKKDCRRRSAHGPGGGIAAAGLIY